MFYIILTLLVVYILINNKDNLELYSDGNFNDILESIQNTSKKERNHICEIEQPCEDAWSIFTDITNILPFSSKDKRRLTELKALKKQDKLNDDSKKLYRILLNRKKITIALTSTPSTMSLKALKRALRDLSIDTQGHSEKSEFIEALRQAQIDALQNGKEKLIQILTGGLYTQKTPRPFCNISSSMYKYIFLYLFYHQYKKEGASFTKLERYKNNLDTNIRETKKLLIENPEKSSNILYKTKEEYNNKINSKDRKALLNVKSNAFNTNANANDVETSKINSIRNSVLTSLNKNLKLKNKYLVYFDKYRKETVSGDNSIYSIKYIEKIVIFTNPGGNNVLEWSEFKKLNKICQQVHEHPEDLLIFELHTEVYTKGKINVIKSLKIKDICLLNIRDCFRINKNDINFRPETTKKLIYYDKAYMKNDFNKRLRKILQIEKSKGDKDTSGSCFDKDNNLILPPRSKGECSGTNVWSYPCTRNIECKYYQTNKNYKNTFGKCDNGYCELPLGIKSIGYNTGISINTSKNQAFLHNCDPSNKDCLKEQENIIKFNEPIDKQIDALEKSLHLFIEFPARRTIINKIKGLRKNNSINGLNKRNLIDIELEKLKQLPKTKIDHLKIKIKQFNMLEQNKKTVADIAKINKNIEIIEKGITARENVIKTKINSKKKPELKSPDYAFLKDMKERKENEQELTEKGLFVSSNTMDLKSIIQNTTFF